MCLLTQSTLSLNVSTATASTFGSKPGLSFTFDDHLIAPIHFIVQAFYLPRGGGVTVKLCLLTKIGLYLKCGEAQPHFLKVGLWYQLWDGSVVYVRNSAGDLHQIKFAALRVISELPPVSSYQ